MYKRNEVIKLRLSDIVKNYRMQNGLTQNDLAKLAKCSKPYISMIENGKDSKTGKPVNPSITFLHNLAIAMNMTSERLYKLLDKDISIRLNDVHTDFQHSLTKKDEKDIQKRLSDILNDMDSQDAIAMYNGGEPMDPETREYMKASLENALRFAKLKAKEKFTPKKYRK